MSEADMDMTGAIAPSAETVETAARLRAELEGTVGWGWEAEGEDGTVGIQWPAHDDASITYIEVGPGSLVKAVRVFADGTSDVWKAEPFDDGRAPSLLKAFPHKTKDTPTP